MKIALCISGQPRGLYTAYEYVKRNLLDKQDVSVFIHTWKGPVYTEQEIVDLYKPTYIYSEEPFSQEFKDNLSKTFTAVDPIKHPVYNTYSYYYSMFYSSLYRIQWEHQHGRFDYVIRSRFDYALNGEIPFEQINRDKIYIPNCRMVPTRDFGNDQFAFGSSPIMTQYMSTFLHMADFAAMGVRLNGEDMMSANLKMNGLVGDRLIYVNMNNPFPPGPYNGTTHSLVRDDMHLWKTF